MKKLIILLFFCVFAYFVNAQNYTPVPVKTPNQTLFYADSLISGDLTSTQKNDAKNFWLNCYNNRIGYLDEATYKYNCHAYAWHISEGGSKVWINTPNDDNYWEDCSYVEVTNQADANKVSFGGPCYQTWTTCLGDSYTNPCDHSAITTSSLDYFISKWGSSPLFRHHKNDCPYSTEDLHYYAPLFISGSSTVCSSGTSFSIDNFPSNASITWNQSSNLSRVSSQGSNPCTFKSSGSGEGWIQPTIDTGFGAITLPRQTVWGGIVLPLDLRLRDRFTGMFKWELCKSEANPVNADHTGGEAHIDDWGWDVSDGYISYDNPYGDNSMVTLRPLSTSFTVELRAHNACGWSEWADMGVSVIYCGGWYMTMYPNPAKDVVTLSFETADEAKTTEGKTRLESKGAREKELNAYSVQIWSEEKGMVKSIQSDEKEIQIPLHGLEKGKYYLHLIYNDKTYKEVLFVE